MPKQTLPVTKAGNWCVRQLKLKLSLAHHLDLRSNGIFLKMTVHDGTSEEAHLRRLALLTAADGLDKCNAFCTEPCADLV